MEALGIAIGAGALPHLSCLWLTGNEISDTGAVALAQALSRGGAPVLKGLYLARNSIGDVGLQALASCCGSHCAGACALLTQLHLGYNVIADDGLLALAEAADRGALGLLERLWLTHCAYGEDTERSEAGEDGACAIATALQAGGLPRLRELHVDCTLTAPWYQQLAGACSTLGVALCAGRVLDRSKVEPKRYRGGGWLT